MRKARPVILALIFLVSASRQAGAAHDAVFPGRVWEEATPESQGACSARLQAAVDYLREAAGKEGVKRMVIVRNGRIIWRGEESTRPQGVWSVTKAFTSTAHGLLIEDGKCTLDTPAREFDPALAEYYPTVTLRHFATMTSGLDGVGGGYDRDEQGRGDQNALVEPLPPFFAPGTKYMYWDEATRVQVPASIPNALPGSSRKGAGVYGYHWWPNGITPEGKRHWPDAPLSTYSRSGYNNNDLFIIPAWNMVTVRLGLDEGEDKITTDEYNTFLRMVGDAILDPVVDGQRWRVEKLWPT